MLKSVAYAQSTDETRYILNGVYFNFKDGKLSSVGDRRTSLGAHGERDGSAQPKARAQSSCRPKPWASSSG
jgi:hypothetical protein